MSEGLYISLTEFKEFDGSTISSALSAEIASRSRRPGFIEMDLLPDPDEVLKNLGEDMPVYRSLLTDAHVWSTYTSRKSVALSCEWGVEEAEGGGAANKKVAEMISEVMASLDSRQVISEILDAVFFGMSPIEIVWMKDGQYWAPERIEGKPPEWFKFNPANELRFISADDEQNGEEIPPYKFLLPRHHASYANPYGERNLSRCFWPVSFKRGGMTFWSIFTEKFGMPYLVGKVPRGTSEPDRVKLRDTLVQMVQDAVAVINADDSIDTLEAKGKAASADIYSLLVKTANGEVSKANLGQTLTTEIDGKGSYAASQSHMEVRQDLGEGDKWMASSAFKTLFRWITEINFPNAQPPVYKAHEEENLQTERAERDERLKDQGVKFTASYYQRVYNLEEDDFELETSEPLSREPGTDSEFAEGDEPALEYQASVDRLADKAIQRALPLFGQIKQQVTDFLAGQKNLKKASKNIAQLYSNPTGNILAEILADSLQRADSLGVQSVLEELGGDTEFAKAQWGPGRPFQEAIEFFRAKGLTISGVSRQDILGDVKTEILKSMEGGLTLKDFRANIGDLFTRRGWDPLNPHHIETIFRTNIQGAYSARRYRQITDPAVTAVRPFWRYVAVDDSFTRPAHRANHGKIFRFDHSFWQTWYPPNEFNCRCYVRTVSAIEMKRRGWTVETEDPTGLLFEPTMPDGTVLPARLMIPDPGWGGQPRRLVDLLERKIDGGEKGRIAWRESRNNRGPMELGRPSEGKIPAEHIRPVPETLEGMESHMQTNAVGREEALAYYENQYRLRMGISPNETFSVLKGPDGELLTADLNGLAHAMLKRADARERFIPLFRGAVENPYEILLTEYETPTGKNKFRKKYVGIYRDRKRLGVIITAEIGPEGNVLWNVMNTKQGNINRQRKGMKVLYGK